LLDYGLEGYGLYWYCIELIAGKVDKNNITFELEHDARIIARNVGSTAQKVEEMMRYFVDTGLFESSDGVITCFKLARRLDQSMTSNPEMRMIIDSLKNHDGVMTESCKIRLDQNRLDENNKDARGATAPKQEPLFSTKSDIKPSLVKELYNDMFSELASWKAKNASRETRLRNFIKSRQADVGEFNMAELETYFICIKNECQWMLEKQNGYKAKNIDFFLSEKCWAGVFEGSYRRDQ